MKADPGIVLVALASPEGVGGTPLGVIGGRSLSMVW